MGAKVRHYGKIEHGKKTYYNPKLYAEQIKALEGKEFMEIIEPILKKPSLDQYGYYRGGILPSCYQSEYFGHFNNKDEIHSLYFAKMFLTEMKIVVLPDRKYEVPETRSLADLSRDEMTQFIDKVIAHCDELEIKILTPQDYYTNKWNRF